MSGRIAAGIIVLAALLAGAGLYYAQVYAYYHPVAAGDAGAEMRLVSIVTGAPEPILAESFEGIDADSSPLRFRACFRTPSSLAMLTETYVAAEAPEPLTGPRWFACYDAVEIGEALERGEALAFLSEPQVHPGVERIVAVFPDGRAYAWHQLTAESRD